MIEKYKNLVNEGEKQFLPNLADVMMKIGNAFADINDLDEAINNYNEAIKIYQDLIKEGQSQVLSILHLLS